MPPKNHLSQQQIARALRYFVLCGAVWAVYGPNATAAGAIFSGFALSIGVTESQIAFLVSLASLAGVSEFLSVHLTRRMRHKRRFMLIAGHLEITAATCVILMAFVAPQYRFTGIAILLVTAYLLGHSVSPLFGAWLSNVIPDAVRATYIGRRMFIVTVTSMAYLYMASAWVDRAQGLRGFAVVFLVGWVAGMAGYWVLGVTPRPPMETASSDAGESLFAPMRERGFRTLALITCFWTAAMSLASAFYAVYMINYVGLTYTRIAIYTNITLLCMVAGYLGFGPIAQRYGSKPVAQLCLIPAIAGRLLWMLTTKENYAWLIPISCALNGLSFSGLSLALGSMLFKIVPKGVENSSYFANYSGLAAIAGATGPFVGGLLRDRLPAELHVMGLELTAIQVIFALSACLLVLPLILSAFLVEPDARSPRYLLGQFRGNLLSFAYNFAHFRTARNDETRAEAIRRIGRSKTPLAVDPLLRALDHVSHDVRSEAAKGLGELHVPEAVDPLVATLEDQESDIRPEAAEALGKIGDHTADGPLLKALRDEDIRVRTSAALALGAIGGEASISVLRHALEGPFDRALFPTVVDAATRGTDLWVVAPIMEGLDRLRKPVIRMQVINGVCRVLGEKNHFYRLATADPLQRATLREPMMQRIVRLLGRSKNVRSGAPAELKARAAEAMRALDTDDVGAFAEGSRAVAEYVLTAEGAPPVARHAALAIIMYLDQGRVGLLEDEGVVFLIIALTGLARSMAGRHSHDPEPGRSEAIGG